MDDFSDFWFFLIMLGLIMAVYGVGILIIRARKQKEEPTTAMKVRAVQMAATQQNDRRDGETCKIGGRWK